MATNSSEILVGANGSVFVAPLGSTAPTDVSTALDVAFIDLGAVNEEGASLNNSVETSPIGIWQDFYPARTVVTGRGFSVSFALSQWNADTLKLAFGGGTVTDDLTVATYVPPSPEVLDERMLVLEWQDGTRIYRLVIPKGMVQEGVETSLTRSDNSELPITFAAASDGTNPVFSLLTNDAAFIA